jgi:hypothetical protein
MLCPPERPNARTPERPNARTPDADEPLLGREPEDPRSVLFNRCAEALERHRQTLAEAQANLRTAHTALKNAEQAVVDATFMRAFLETLVEAPEASDGEPGR